MDGAHLPEARVLLQAETLRATWLRRIQHAAEALQSSRSDKTILAFYAWQVGGIIQQMKRLRGYTDPEYIEELIMLAAGLRQELHDAQHACGPTAISGTFVPAIRVVPTASGGRPRIHADPAFLSHAVNRLHLGLKEIGELLFPLEDKPISSSTVRRLLLDHGLREPHSPTRQFAEISDVDLVEYVRYILELQPAVGYRYMRGALTSLGIFVPRERVRRLCREVNPIGAILREAQVAVRREYTNDGPNACWHMDGHHKLVDNGIVIHGFIDGDSRGIVGLRAHSNNRADTVLALFKDSTRYAGIPSRVRGDRGGENLEVAVLMTCLRGINRGSFLWGTSPHNTRIERLWPEVFRLCVARWYALFTTLERFHGYSHDDDAKVWLGVFLFIDDINTELEFFKAQHNSHAISSAGGRSPEQLFFINSTKNGVRGLWEGEFLEDPDEARAATVTEYMKEEINGHVELDDPRCPFWDAAAGTARLRHLMADLWTDDRELLWRRALNAMYTVLSDEEAEGMQ